MTRTCCFFRPALSRLALSLSVLLLALGSAQSAEHAPEAAPAWVDGHDIRFVRVPAGSFVMGLARPAESLTTIYPELTPDRVAQFSDELPAHRVEISRSFYLGQYEVTVDEFRRFVAASGYVPDGVADGTGAYGYSASYDRDRPEKADAFEGRSPRYSWADPGFTQGPQEPVTNVSWNDANAMARWLSQREGVRYRLPTEAEWEYACRAGSQTLYPHGDDPAGLVRSGNTFDRAALPFWKRWHQNALGQSDGFPFTAPVGRFAPNAFGLYDMLGNVWEWVSDRYSDTYYAESPVRDPAGPAEGGLHVRRGGSWHTWSVYARCGFRNWNTPQSRYPLLGFRLVREIPDRAAASAP